nr:hypothetical protein [Tanacetum cinerariifolium]
MCMKFMTKKYSNSFNIDNQYEYTNCTEITRILKLLATQQWNSFALTVGKCTSSGIFITSSENDLEHFIPNKKMCCKGKVMPADVQTLGSGISIPLAVGTPSIGSGNLYCQWELSPSSGNALCILFPTDNDKKTQTS